jgi:hypothetical protein
MLITSSGAYGKIRFIYLLCKILYSIVWNYGYIKSRHIK